MAAAHVGATPVWAIAPFAAYLLMLATLPAFLGRMWDSNLNKLVLAVGVGLPAAIYLLAGRPDGGALLARVAWDYLAFMALLGALFTISGGISLEGTLVGTPAVNTGFLAAGCVLGSAVGTMGASVLLIRPLLRANVGRRRAAHVVVFFIFIVSNASGLLTPLGPPLYLGFMRGVPFSWTLRLAPVWALVNGALLALFAIVDAARARREGPRASAPRAAPLRLVGGLNIVWLAGLVTAVFLNGTYGARVLGAGHAQSLVQLAASGLFAGLSWATTPRTTRAANRFSWAPLAEIAAIFVGIFVTMAPALSFLEERGASLGVTKPWQFFWASGALSSVLDNAPTYLAFCSLAAGVVDAGRGVLSSGDLGPLAAHPAGRALLAAVSCGSVLMGAVTYIGNGPNFVVKAIAEQHGVRTPGFGGYLLWSLAILLPLFAVVTAVFF